MKISCLLLAAGHSSRMGGKNKLTLQVDEKSLIRRTLLEIQKIPFLETILVTGFQSEKIIGEVKDLHAQIVFNENHSIGMHTSIRAGLKSMQKTCNAFFVCLGDQPYFDHQVLNLMIQAFENKNPSESIFVPTYADKRGHPVLIDSKYIPEILEEADGDYGCAYLLKRYPEAVVSIPMKSSGILIDIDEPKDYQKLLDKSYDSLDPVAEFHSVITHLREENKIFAVATVIEVIGSASARTGSKAIFNDSGKNILGWVGGGCAERFIGEECQEAMKDGKTRIVLADLDDEIFGLGVACGGKMRVFIDPILPPETVLLPETKFANEVRVLSGFYGWNVKKDFHQKSPETIEDLLVLMAKTVGAQRGHTNKSLREIKDVPAIYKPAQVKMNKEVTIVGRTRITEALARHFTLLSYSVRVLGPDLKQDDYPTTVKCSCLEDGYGQVEFRTGEVVIIASHTAQDPSLVKKALDQKASYISMVGSRKRVLEVLTHLDLMDKTITEPLFVPAGLDIDARNPDEIALSIVAEVILESRRLA